MLIHYIPVLNKILQIYLYQLRVNMLSKVVKALEFLSETLDFLAFSEFDHRLESSYIDRRLILLRFK